MVPHRLWLGAVGKVEMMAILASGPTCFAASSIRALPMPSKVAWLMKKTRVSQPDELKSAASVHPGKFGKHLHLLYGVRIDPMMNVVARKGF